MNNLQSHPYMEFGSSNSFEKVEEMIFTRVGQAGFAGVFITGISSITHDIKLISNFPGEFISPYCSNKYFLHDPVLQHCSSHHSPVTWHDSYRVALKSKETRLLHQLSLAAGIEHCLAVPTFTNRGAGVVNLLFSGTKEDFLRLCAEKYAELIGLSQLFFGELSKNHPEKLFMQFKLTTREEECLQFIVKGLSNLEISRLMNVSRDRVKELVSLILKKLEAANRTEAVMIAAKSGAL
ncbi:autoinducer binding domain-containing protein [Thalassomonas viridans]|uniref:Autoinducer binding domain-containing protein n=1 Tax=Thalassomonas viridans TaxID=137584 RepID=A0AAE9Z5G8_9GAMM|nr:autoinducer binding domain-containing protein [Thalassomonas viridans]WDE07015.1 autoinducer binding domain-containing protein [Thalassomonas viridans]